MANKPPQETRNSLQFFTRGVTVDIGDQSPGSPSTHHKLVEETNKWTSQQPTQSKHKDTHDNSLSFYRKRLDASTRNRIYLHNVNEPLSTDEQHSFRELLGSAFGGLILHSSLVGAIPARLTNAVDIYSLH